MADWYNKTLTKIGKSLLDLNSLSNPKIIPMTNGYVFSQTHEFLSDLTPAERVAAGVALNNVVFGGDPAPTDYVAYYSMDNAQVAGSTLLDLSGNDHTATMVNTPTTGEVGQVNESVLFDSASSEYATIVDHADLKLTEVAVVAWIKTSTTGVIQGIFQSWSANTEAAGYALLIGANNKVQLHIGSDTGTVIGVDRESTSSTTTVTDGNWHFVVGTYDGVDLKVYVDGVLEATEGYAGGIVHDATNYIRIANRNETGTEQQFLNGKPDELKIFPRAITGDDVAALFIADGGILTGNTAGDGWLDADDPTIVSPTLDDIIEAFVVYNDTGTEATSPIILYSDSSPGLPYTVETTGAIKVQFESSGIAKL